MESIRSANCMASRLVRVWHQPSGCISLFPWSWFHAMQFALIPYSLKRDSMPQQVADSIHAVRRDFRKQGKCLVFFFRSRLAKDKPASRCQSWQIMYVPKCHASSKEAFPLCLMIISLITPKVNDPSAETTRNTMSVTLFKKTVKFTLKNQRKRLTLQFSWCRIHSLNIFG